jgi:serine/threonine-protein kinase
MASRNAKTRQVAKAISSKAKVPGGTTESPKAIGVGRPMYRADPESYRNRVRLAAQMALAINHVWGGVDLYAAIAFSKSTGETGWAYGYESQEEAEEEALSTCDAPDAEIVGWSVNAWCDLATGDNGGYGFAWGDTQEKAEKEALSVCARSDTGGRIVVSISGFYNRYAAIAYSKATGEHGWSSGYESREEAKEEALTTCDAPDAEIVGVSMNAWRALAVGDNGNYGCSVGRTQDEAESKAILKCSAIDTGARVIASISAFLNLFAALAYSDSTGKYGYCCGADSCEKAEEEAVSACSAPDAKIVERSVNGWCALAVGDNGSYGAASGRTQEEAESKSLLKCSERDTSAQTVVSICAFGKTAGERTNGVTAKNAEKMPATKRL